MTVHLSELVWSHWPRRQLCVRRDTASVLRATREGPRDWQEWEGESRAESWWLRWQCHHFGSSEKTESGKAWCFKTRGKDLLTCCLGGRARRWDMYPSDWELWGSPAQDLTKISFGFDINTHMRSNWYLFTGWIILADKTTSFKQ